MKSTEYVIYLRKSSEDKKKQVQSLWDQLRACLDYAKQHNLNIKKRPLDFSMYETDKDILEQWNLKDERDKKLFRDNDHLFIVKESYSWKDSGTRKKWWALTKYLISMDWAVWLMSYSPDRQSRNLVEAWELIEMVEKVWMELRYPTFHFENNASWKMMLGIWFVLSKQYVDNLKETSTRGSKSAHGKWTALWYHKHGYEINDNKYHEPWQHFDLIRKAFEMKIYENKTNVQIIRYLNAKKYTYKHWDELKSISNNTIKTIFEDSFYYGIFSYGGESIDLREYNPHFKPIITEQEYNKLTAMYQANKSNKELKERKKEYEEILPFSRRFIKTWDNYSISGYIPSFKERFPDRLKKMQEKNPKLQMIDIIKDHQIIFKVWCKKSNLAGYEVSYEKLKPYILKELKKLKLNEEHYEMYATYIQTSYKQQKEENNKTRQTLQIQRNNIDKEMCEFIEKCLGKERNSNEEEVYQKKLRYYQSTLDWLDSDINALNTKDRDIVFEFQILSEFLKKAEHYYLKASYVQKRKIHEILFSNIIITPKNISIKPREGLEGLFNLKWQAH